MFIHHEGSIDERQTHKHILFIIKTTKSAANKSALLCCSHAKVCTCIIVQHVHTVITVLRARCTDLTKWLTVWLTIWLSVCVLQEALTVG